MRISEIKQTSPGKLCICLEDGREIKSTLATVTDLRLFSGRELDGEELRELHAILERAEKQKKNRENEPKPVD